MKVTVIPLVVGALGTVSKFLEKIMGEFDISNDYTEFSSLVRFGLETLFSGISKFVGYLMPKAFLKRIFVALFNPLLN